MNVRVIQRPMTLEQVLFEMAEIEERIKVYESGSTFDRDAWRYFELLGCTQYAAHKINVFEAILGRMSPSMLKWVEPQVRSSLAEHQGSIARCRIAFARPASLPETTP